jgi:hypothetical protein
MTDDQSLFDKTKPLKSSRSINVAGGSTLKAVGEGDIVLDSGLIITNVLFVPKLGYNLLSVPSIVKKDMTVSFDLNCCQIKQHGQLDLKAQKFGDLYMVNLNKNSSALYSSSKIKNELFYQRFGHFGHKRLRKVAQKLSVILSNKRNQFHYESCIFGKHSRQKFKASLRKTRSPGELIHTDLMGPFP